MILTADGGTLARIRRTILTADGGTFTPHPQYEFNNEGRRIALPELST